MATRALALALLLTSLAACKDDTTTTTSLKPCLDRPTDLARPPSSALPCDLLPPDFGKK